MEEKEYSISTYWDEDRIQLSPEDASAVLIETIDIDSHLLAIYETFRWIESLKKEKSSEIKKLEEATKNPQDKNLPFTSVDFLVGAYHQSVYVDAANSMSTIGMIAPTLESILYEIFKNIGTKYEHTILNESSSRFKLKEKEKFDCHYFFDKKLKKGVKGLTKGAIELIEDTGLITYLPSDLSYVIDAIFSYRNKMFHNGFEWPESEKIIFEKKINNSNWPQEWFSKATSDNKPWIFYMTDLFQTKCIKTINDIIIGTGNFVINHEKNRKQEQFQ